MSDVKLDPLSIIAIVVLLLTARWWLGPVMPLLSLVAVVFVAVKLGPPMLSLLQSAINKKQAAP